MLHSHDPIITKKIHFIKGLLKEYAVYSRDIKAYYSYNHPLITKYMSENDCLNYYEAERQLKGIIKEHPKTKTYWLYVHPLTITCLHIYYLKVKGSTKQHTKDDKKYETIAWYKILVEKLEKDFQLLLKAGEEGISHG